MLRFKMMKAILFLYLAVLLGKGAAAQELFVATEPASNMPVHTLGFRTTIELLSENNTIRFAPELMLGASKHLMLHGALYYSDFYPGDKHFEGFSSYAKYRLLSHDTIQQHFRGAVYGRYAHSNHLTRYDEINLEGDNSGLQGGLIFTQLIRKLALSASAGYLTDWDTGHPGPVTTGTRQQLSYSFSGGYLLFPKEYTSYGQTNMNLYLEFLGKSDLNNARYFIEAAPAVQFIFGSRLRFDLSKRVQLSGNMTRPGSNEYLVRLEYTFFNVL